MIVPYCDSCQPSETAWNDVTLDCSPAASTSPAATATNDVATSTGIGTGASSATTSDPAAAASSAPQLVKRVQIITNCSCAPCERSIHPAGASGGRPNLSSALGVHDDPASSANFGKMLDDAATPYDVPLNDGPELLNELQRRNESKTPSAAGGGPEGLRRLMDNRIVELLQRIQETNQPEDKQQLKMLLQTIQVIMI